MVSKLPEELFEEWQNSLGFESAEKYFKPVFDELDRIDSYERAENFAAKYSDILFVEINDNGEYSFDYPYCNSIWLRLMNKDGVFKVGTILHSYNKKYIAVLDGDMEKLKRAIQTPSKYLDNMLETKVFVEDNSKLKSDIFYEDYNGDKNVYTGWLEYDGSGLRVDVRLESLTMIQRVQSTQKFSITGYSYLWMKSQKKNWGVWKARESNYRINTFCAEIGYVDVNGNPVVHTVYSNTDYTSPIGAQYTQFIFDKYEKIYNTEPQGWQNIPHYINTKFEITSSLIGWDPYFTLRYPNTFEYNTSYPSYTSGYPEWKQNN